MRPAPKSRLRSLKSPTSSFFLVSTEMTGCCPANAVAPKGQSEQVRVHDFLIKELGRAVPYGVYDLAADHGWVSVGVDHDTAAFAVQTIRRWWQEIGRIRYPEAKKLFITADGGAAIARVRACGSASCNAWPTRSESTSRSVTFHQASLR